MQVVGGDTDHGCWSVPVAGGPTGNGDAIEWSGEGIDQGAGACEWQVTETPVTGTQSSGRTPTFIVGSVSSR